MRNGPGGLKKSVNPDKSGKIPCQKILKISRIPSGVQRSPVGVSRGYLVSRGHSPLKPDTFFNLTYIFVHSLGTRGGSRSEKQP